MGFPARATPEPGVLRQVLAYNPNLMLLRHKFEMSWAGVRHSGPHQLVYVVQSHVSFDAGDQRRDKRTGDGVVVNRGIKCRLAADENPEVLHFYTPYREDCGL